MKIYEVGGCVRDEFLGVPSKDVDFAVEAESFDAMRDYLNENGFEIFVETPEYLTIRANPPKDSPLSERTNGADFVLCRKDSPGSDGRRPDYVEVGTIYDDLARRDFTVNAIAKNCETGEILDPFNGIQDLIAKKLRFVGDPYTRIKEDGLRVVRAYRFMITKNLKPTPETSLALSKFMASDRLWEVSIQRVRDELEKMFKYDTLKTLEVINKMSFDMKEAIFRDGLRLSATLKT